MTTGKLFILSAPSGAGKTTLLKRVMADLPGLAFSVSHTTRLPRAGEEDGADYHFVSRDRFEAMREQGLFLEWAEVHGNFYGTSRPAVLAQLAEGLDVVLDIDVQGAAILRKSAVIPDYEYLIVNADLEQAVETLRAIVIAERSRGHRLATGQPIDILSEL